MPIKELEPSRIYTHREYCENLENGNAVLKTTPGDISLVQMNTTGYIEAYKYVPEHSNITGQWVTRDNITLFNFIDDWDKRDVEYHKCKRLIGNIYKNTNELSDIELIKALNDGEAIAVNYCDRFIATTNVVTFNLSGQLEICKRPGSIVPENINLGSLLDNSKWIITV